MSDRVSFNRLVYLYSIHLSVTVSSLTVYMSFCNSICLSVRHLNFSLIGSVYLSLYIYFCLILCHLRLSVYVSVIYISSIVFYCIVFYCIYCIVLYCLFCIVLYCLYLNGLFRLKLYYMLLMCFLYNIRLVFLSLFCLKKLRVLLSLSLGEVRSYSFKLGSVRSFFIIV